MPALPGRRDSEGAEEGRLRTAPWRSRLRQAGTARPRVYSQCRCRARPVVNGTSQPDLFLKPVVVSVAAPSAGRHRLRRCKLGRRELALYSLTGRANFPFHAEPAQKRGGYDVRKHGHDSRSLSRWRGIVSAWRAPLESLRTIFTWLPCWPATARPERTRSFDIRPRRPAPRSPG